MNNPEFGKFDLPALELVHKDWVRSFDAIRDPIFMHDKDFCIIRANQAYARKAGLPITDLLGKPFWEVFPRHDGPLSSCTDLMHDPALGETREEYSLENGEVYVSRSYAVADDGGKYCYSVHIMEDITELRKLTECLHRENRAHKVISSSNQTLLHAHDENRLLQDVCAIITRLGEYRLAWIGFQQNHDENHVMPVASSGLLEIQLIKLIALHDKKLGRETIVGRAIISGQHQTLNMTSASCADPYCSALHEEGCNSTLVLPITNELHGHGVMVICAESLQAFDEDEIRLLDELAADLTFGLNTLHNRREKKRVERDRFDILEKLRSSFSKTIEAIATATEARDPYTAGHQRRVADLARAIATELELSRDQLEGIYMASLVHDIGKLHVPVELLSNPRRLESVEFEIIKTHADVGNKILRNIEFPWPIAEMVYQHHERIDGSGYPQGLTGDDILIEAQVIGIADVIEAIVSHRPYRPAFDLSVAIEEIKKFRGTRFHADIVDACLRVLEDNKYEFLPGIPG